MEDNDAQRALEQKALKNVRGLVDKIEQSDKAEKSFQAKVLIGFIVAIVALGALWMTGVIGPLKGGAGKEIVVPPPKPPSK